MRLTRLITFRSIRTRSTRFLLSAFGIVLGVAGLLSIRATNQTAMNSILELFESTSGRAKLTITSSNADEGGFSDQILAKIQRVPGVMVANPFVISATDLVNSQSTDELEMNFFGTNSGGIVLHGIIPDLETQTRDYKLTAGQFLSENLRTLEIVLVEDLAEDEGISIGDRINLITPIGNERLKVVGLIAMEGPGQTNNGSFGVIPYETAKDIFERGDEIDQIDIVTTEPNPDSDALAALRTELQNLLGEDYSVTYPSGQGERMTQMLQNYQIGLNFMSGIALFVGAFLIYNAFAMTVVERTREFGLLRTIGMTRQQVMGQVFIEATLLGVVGSGFGIGLGILMALGLTRFMEIILGQSIGNVQISNSDLVFSMLIGVGVTFLAAGIPAWQAGRISAIEALRVRGKSKEGWLIRYGWTVGLLMLIISIVILLINPFPYDVQFRMGSMTVFGLFTGATLMIPITVGLWERVTRPILKWIYGSSGALGSRNVQRSKLRTTLTVAALMVGVAMIIIVRGMTESFASDLQTWIQAYLGGDIYITSSVRLRNDIRRRIQVVDGVYALAPMRYFEVEWETPTGERENLQFMAVDVDEYARVTNFVFSGEQVNPDQAIEQLKNTNTVFVSSVVAEKNNLSPGDTIRLKTRRGMTDFTIAGVVVDFFNQGLVIQGDWKTMWQHFRINDASTYLAKIAPGSTIAQVKENIETLYGDRYHLTLETNSSIRNQALNLMEQAFRMFDVVALISIVVGSLGVVNTLTMSVIERTQEIGMLRAIGTSRGQIIRMVLAESGLMGVIGGVLGLATGVVLARILFIGMNTMSGYQLTFSIPPEGLAVSIVMALIVSQIAAISPARRAAKTEILEAIHYE
jgi:putative ABC transport system permease protein